MILGARTYTVSRVAAGGFGADGGWSDGATSTFTVVGSWQPLNGREAQALPEGYRDRQTAKLYCDPLQPALYPVRPGSAQRPDVVERDGVSYLVVAAADWTDGPIPHRAYMLAEVAADQVERP